MTHYINGQWQPGSGQPVKSASPVSQDIVWQGYEASPVEVQAAVFAANAATQDWQAMPFERRVQHLQKYTALVKARAGELAELITQETGKALWDATNEVKAVCAKLEISIQSFAHRTPLASDPAANLTHRPHGVMVVLGPYNFPCHLPNGHIIPALLAGNTVVFKPSEETPACGAFLMHCFHDAGIPAGVVNLLQGGKDVGRELVNTTTINGVLFTGSEAGGIAIHKQLAGRPEVMLAMELGGNNPLVVCEDTDLESAAMCVAESAYISAGQRCTCARRLLVPAGSWGDSFLLTLTKTIAALTIDKPDASPQPFMGSLISERAAAHVISQQQDLLERGATALLQAAYHPLGNAFVTPGLIDITDIETQVDEEIFGPVLQIIRYDTFSDAIHRANQTRFGLSAGLITHSQEKFDHFRGAVNAGIINWNTPLTGASSAQPFGGIGRSGNHRPGAYYAADYCAYPIATSQSPDPTSPAAARFKGNIS